MSVARGLENVIVAESSISFIDGRKGKLLYRGYNIKDLAKHSCFEEVAYLLLHGSLPTRKELHSFRKELAGRREIPVRIRHILGDLCRDLLPIDALRSVVSLLKCYDPAGRERSAEANIKRGTDLIAKFPTIVAYYYRTSHGLELMHPKEGLGHAENFLYMLKGKRPGRLARETVDLDFLLHAEHGLNASTFAARVTTSTLADMYAAITSAVGTLEGPLHGGAASRVIRMLEEIGEKRNVGKYVKEALASRKRIMGFGHRVYKTLDPRVLSLREMAKKACRKDMKFYNMIAELERAMEKEGMYKRGIFPNVDLYSGTVYRSLGIPDVLFDPMFALGRIAGWTAHVLEQLGDNRLIRPRARYTGKMDLKFVPIEKRRRKA
jgi:citrate synthase